MKSATILSKPSADAPRQRPGASRQLHEQLLEQCRDLAVERLTRVLSEMLDRAGDTLGKLGNAAHDAGAQKLYMKARDKLLPQ